MEDVYDFPKNNLINVRAIEKKYREILEKHSLPTNDEEIKMAMKFQGSDEEFKKLRESVSLDVAKCPVPIVEFDSEKSSRKTISNPLLNIPTLAFELETTKELFEYRGRIFSRHGARRVYPFGKTEFNYRIIKRKLEPIPINDKDILPYTDVLLTVRVYRPFRYNSSSTYGPTFQEEFLVFGNQYLTELRDKISCNFNNHCVTDISSDLDQELPKPQANPGFFFITDTFYNDTRDPKNPDYSLNIKKWLKGQTEFCEKIFKTTKMEETKFLDLNLRLGFPQVYQHSGNCEHLFCFSSIQILTKNDHLKKSEYPLVTFVSIAKNATCNMCGNAQFTHIIRESNRQLSDPAYLCEQCVRNYHYIDGKKIGNFKVYMIMESNIEDDSDEDMETN